MDFQKLKMDAAQSLQRENYPVRKLTAIHTGAALGLSLVLSLVSFLLGKYADTAGGLSAMGMQTVIGTVQMLLPLLTMILNPFWEAGYQHTALNYVRWQKVEPENLLEGFRRWKPILISGLMVALLYFGRMFIAAFISGQLVMFTPAAAPIYAAADQIQANPYMDIYALLGDALVPFMLTYMAIFALAFAALALPVYYRYRMVPYAILSNPQMGAMEALFTSRKITFHRRRELFRLDLHFWWFYGLCLLSGVLCYGDLLLPLVGVQLPVEPEAASWGFLLISMVVQLLVYLWAKPTVESVWAMAFETMTGNDASADGGIVEQNFE